MEFRRVRPLSLDPKLSESIQLMINRMYTPKGDLKKKYRGDKNNYTDKNPVIFKPANQ